MTNTVDVDFAYRFPRLRQIEQRYLWAQPFGFCQGRPYTKPNRTMVETAIDRGGWVLKEAPGYTLLPPSGVIRCGTENVFWIINEQLRQQIVTSARFTLARRDSQSITEHYRLRVKADESVNRVGELGRTLRASASVDADTEPFTDFPEYDAPPEGAVRDQAGDWVLDVDKLPGSSAADARFAMEVLLDRARTQILASHRENSVGFATPLHPALERHDTVSVSQQRVAATGKVRHLLHQLDIEAGSATTQVSLALSRVDAQAAQTDTPRIPPQRPDTLGEPGIRTQIVLPSRYGGLASSAPFDEDWVGYTGNRMIVPPGSVVYDQRTEDVEEGEEPATAPGGVLTVEPGTEEYPQRFSIDTPEIPADLRDAREVEMPGEYTVAIPDDPLTLSEQEND